MTAEQQTAELAVALEATFATDNYGRTGHDLADQYMAALSEAAGLEGQRESYADWVKLASRPGIRQQEIDYLRRKCVVIALRIAQHRGELRGDWLNF